MFTLSPLASSNLDYRVKFGKKREFQTLDNIFFFFQNSITKVYLDQTNFHVLARNFKLFLN